MATDPVHLDAVQVLGEWQPPDAEQFDLRTDYLAHLAHHADATSRDCRLGHLTASALVWQVTADGPRVLLTLHARIGRWLQMGGHIEPADLSLAEAARREAIEESGITELTLHPKPLRLDRHRVSCRLGDRSDLLDHLDVQYLAVADPTATATISAESADLAWYPVRAGIVLGCPVDASVARLVRAAWAVRGDG